MFKLFKYLLMEKKEKRKGNKKITKFCIHFLLLIFLILLFSQTIFASVDCPRNCDCYNDAHCQRWGQHCIITWWVDCDEDSDCDDSGRNGSGWDKYDLVGW